MKLVFLTVTLLGFLGLGAQHIQAQAYGPYYGTYEYGPHYQPALPDNPYYQLEMIHYQLYLPYHQPYPVYQLYQPCCMAGAVIIPRLPAGISTRPPVIISPRGVRRR